jgi:hypothetical protein
MFCLCVWRWQAGGEKTSGAPTEAAKASSANIEIVIFVRATTCENNLRDALRALLLVVLAATDQRINVTNHSSKIIPST